MRLSKIHDQLKEEGFSVETLRLAKGDLVVIAPEETRTRREAATVRARILKEQPEPMGYLEALGRMALGRDLEARKVVAAEVARRTAGRGA